MQVIDEGALGSAGQRRHNNKGPLAPPKDPNKTLVLAHALICTFGFAFCLPAGAILARYFRTSRPWWYKGHWIAQFGIAGPVIVLGVSLGFVLSGQIGKTPGDSHKDLGSAIFFMYIAQCGIGAVIHFFKPKNAKRRPIQNYFHAILGITILVLGMYQIHTGYADEWPKFASLGTVSKAVNVLWILWCLIIVAVYTVGLRYLRTQYAQEAASRQRAKPFVANGSPVSYNMDIMRWKPGDRPTV
ncbi:hypothetical protein C8R45DRAFT_832225 [Mycena sanguinolenta]|nr:hypothetical protein C8R45DRAFT_832225 [Mycena sanguinolenta]